MKIFIRFFSKFILFKIGGISKHCIKETVEDKINDSERYYKIPVPKKRGRMNIWTGMILSFLAFG